MKFEAEIKPMIVESPGNLQVGAEISAYVDASDEVGVLCILDSICARFLNRSALTNENSEKTNNILCVRQIISELRDEAFREIIERMNKGDDSDVKY